jgi:hypothetical protein
MADCCRKLLLGWCLCIVPLAAVASERITYYHTDALGSPMA